MVLEHLLAFFPEAPDRVRASVEALSAEERSRLRQEANRQGFESLLAATGVPEFAAAPPLARVERFQFTRHRHATLDLARHLTDAGIDVLLIKGSVLADRLYVMPPLESWMRPPGDIDLFVSPSALDRAVEVLRGAGLELVDDPRVRRSSVKHSVDFRGIDGRLAGLFVELHAHLSHSPWRENLEFEALFERGEALTTENPCQRVLDPIDELIFLASHGVGHRFEHVKWLFDLKLRAMQPQGFDWSPLWPRAEACRSARALALALWTLEQRLSIDLTAYGIERRRVSRIRRTLYDTARSMDSSWSAPRGLLTCLLLVDEPSLSLVKPLTALALDKLRSR